MCVCAASPQTLSVCCLPLSKLTENKWSTTRAQTRMCCAANFAVDVAVAPLFYSCNKWAHKMHCRAAQQTTPKNKPRKRHHAKNATDRQQTNRQKNRKTDGQEGRTESNPYSWWTLAACGPRRVRNNHPVQMPMWPQEGKGREAVERGICCGERQHVADSAPTSPPNQRKITSCTWNEAYVIYKSL